MDHQTVKRAMARALQGGARRLSLSHAEWEVAGNCSEPVYLDLQAPPSEGPDGAPRGSSLHLGIWIRCRKCEACLQVRSRLWALRATNECRQSIRTWFGTLTVKPTEQHKAYCTAAAEYAASGDFDGLDYKAQFARRVRVLNREITRYVKRLRKESGAKLRILFVAEHHKSGLPHFHCLIHEHDIIGVSEEMLRRQWKLGFTKWDLIATHAGASTYVCKYLGKSGASRIRASVGYGNTSLDIANAFKHESAQMTPPKHSLPKAPVGAVEGSESDRKVAYGGLI